VVNDILQRDRENKKRGLQSTSSENKFPSKRETEDINDHQNLKNKILASQTTRSKLADDKNVMKTNIALRVRESSRSLASVRGCGSGANSSSRRFHGDRVARRMFSLPLHLHLRPAAARPCEYCVCPSGTAASSPASCAAPFPQEIAEMHFNWSKLLRRNKI